MGHCPTRANREIKPEGQRPLPPNTVTIGKILKSAGYKTATMGKWGMGMFDTSGSPFKNGDRSLLRLQLPAPRPQLLP